MKTALYLISLCLFTALCEIFFQRKINMQTLAYLIFIQINIQIKVNIE